MNRRERRASGAARASAVNSEPASDPEFRRWAADLANANRAIITSDFASVRAIVDSASVVFGVWQDAAEPNGVGMLVVKGQALLRNIVADGEARPVEMNAVPCTCAGQAEALRIQAGETERLH